MLMTYLFAQGVLGIHGVSISGCAARDQPPGDAPNLDELVARAARPRAVTASGDQQFETFETQRRMRDPFSRVAT